MRVLLAALLLIVVRNSPVAAQHVATLPAGPTLARATPSPLPASRRTTPSFGPGRTDGSCAYSWRERAVGGALIGGTIGAGIGYLMSVLTLADDHRRTRATFQMALGGAAVGAVWGATVTCRAPRPDTGPRWRRPRGR